MVRTALLVTTVLVALAGVSRAQPVTGLYIGGGGGANFLQREKVDALVYPNGIVVPTNRRTGFRVGVVGLASVGYGFGNGLRLEIEGNYRNNQLGTVVAAPSSTGGREQKYGAMGNVLFDLDIGSPYVFPYIGAGVGYERVERTQRLSGTIGYALPGNVTATVPNSGLTTTGTDGGFAYQAIAGVSFPIPPVVGLSLTAEYRYLAMAGERSFIQTPSNGTPFAARSLHTKEDYNHSLILGLRYAFNTPAPASVAAVETPQIVVAPAKTYLVFFDWDRADLTARARSIINEAAQATTRVAVTRIEVAGHTDSSGTVRYNQGLSTRRAQTVAAELVRLGVPRSSITTQAFGESRPLVQTANGVREPQNRRVEIVLR